MLQGARTRAACHPPRRTARVSYSTCCLMMSRDSRTNNIGASVPSQGRDTFNVGGGRRSGTSIYSILVIAWVGNPTPPLPTLNVSRPWLGTLAPILSVRVSPYHTGHPFTYLTRAVRRTSGGGAHSSSTACDPIRHLACLFPGFQSHPPVSPASTPPTLSQTRPWPGTIAPIFLVRVSRDPTGHLSNYLTLSRDASFQPIAPRLTATWPGPGE